uniref:Dol-P-Glc:Glc(2)Man(9)GlcNAc(2)-PP-Dol alpha-1,2-glucosyltransferase n=2 Tax=Neobodo designis TaxID=312471 RepID=A0A7S1R058_NEODS|mmetsp:Transcript_5983/g.18881  ORF Transcript_5983/g.18881 Transcript_5983/m.18881 type:complete len:547 (+) Transcript_5983:90-1730(+)
MGCLDSCVLFSCVLAFSLFGPIALHGVVLSPPSTVAENAGKPCNNISQAVLHRRQGDDGVSLKNILSPYTYMDEVFHVPQAMQYALLDDYASYDPMITTPPGAYVFAYAVVRPIVEVYRRKTADFQPVIDGVNTAAWAVTLCRASNAVAMGVLAIVAKAIFAHDVGALLVIAIPPLAFGGGVLFYTEALSTLACTCVLHGYIRGILRAKDPETARKWWVIVALAGLWAITIRQTNIVWLFYVAAHNFICVVVPRLRSDAADRADATEEELAAASPPRAARTRPTAAVTAGYVLQRIASYLRDVSPVILVAAAFAAFIAWNDFAIVLGDKTKHVPIAHWAQVPYFFATIALLLPFSTLYAVGRTVGTGGLRGVFVLGGVAVPLLVAALGDAAVVFHPYLVADNRHFTNALYRHVLRVSWRRMAAVLPLAAGGCAAFMHQTIGASRNWIASPTKGAGTNSGSSNLAPVAGELLLLGCVLAACVPQGLLEPRYFVMPLVAHLCHMSRATPRALLALDAMAMLVIHAGTVWVFVNRPFVAPDGSVGRYMW